MPGGPRDLQNRRRSSPTEVGSIPILSAKKGFAGKQEKERRGGTPGSCKRTDVLDYLVGSAGYSPSFTFLLSLKILIPLTKGGDLDVA